LPEALIKFLAFLGWNPGPEQEIFDLQGLSQAFSLEHVSRSGARFDFDKALWFNQQYILACEPEVLADYAKPIFKLHRIEVDQSALISVCKAYRERIKVLPDLVTESKYLFGEIIAYDQDTIAKKWTADLAPHFIEIANLLSGISDFDEASIKEPVMGYIKSNGLKMGVIFPLLRIAISGSPSGPEVFVMLELLGRDNAVERLRNAPETFGGMA
jgi:glutamyl-tRNA synthetase